MAPLQRRMSVFVVDDDHDVRDALTRFLEASGADVAAAATARDAIATIRRRLPDVIVLDLTMPEMDGFGVIDALKEDTATAAIPILIFTGRPLTRLRSIPRVCTTVPKPCTPDHLLRVLQELVEKGPGTPSGQTRDSSAERRG